MSAQIMSQTVVVPVNLTGKQPAPQNQETPVLSTARSGGSDTSAPKKPEPRANGTTTTTVMTQSRAVADQTLFQRWFAYNKSRSEMEYCLRQGVKQLRGRFSFERESGCEDLLAFLCAEVATSKDQIALFARIQLEGNKHTNILSALHQTLLKHGKAKPDRKDSQLADAIGSRLSPKEELRIGQLIECVFANLDGKPCPIEPAVMKFLISMLSTDDKNLEQKMAAADALTFVLMNSPRNLVSFCKFSGVDALLAATLDKLAPRTFRRRCTELLLLLALFLRQLQIRGDAKSDYIGWFTDKLNAGLGPATTQSLLALAGGIDPFNLIELFNAADQFVGPSETTPRQQQQ